MCLATLNDGGHAMGTSRPRARLRIRALYLCLSSPAAATAELTLVVVLEEGGALMRAKAKASARGLGCGGTRLEGIPEEGWGCGCECGTCGDDEWEVVGDDGDGCSGELDTPEMEAETLTWALEMGAWAVCVGVGLLATARRFRRKRAFW
uniref:Uncharacterized protein n=1 Tax=Oryza punctata TaxID=4537 RepID=A0A0E0K7U3_ORYPU